MEQKHNFRQKLLVCMTFLFLIVNTCISVPPETPNNPLIACDENSTQCDILFQTIDYLVNVTTWQNNFFNVLVNETQLNVNVTLNNTDILDAIHNITLDNTDILEAINNITVDFNITVDNILNITIDNTEILDAINNISIENLNVSIDNTEVLEQIYDLQIQNNYLTEQINLTQNQINLTQSQLNLILDRLDENIAANIENISTEANIQLLTYIFYFCFILGLLYFMFGFENF